MEDSSFPRQNPSPETPAVTKPGRNQTEAGPDKKKYKWKPSTMQILVLGYLAIILVGSFFLSLPISNREGVWTPYIDALLTATSATCVTGLVTLDTFIYWNWFGQILILLLIQIGGLGFMTFVTLFSFALGRRIGLFERTLIAQSAGSFTKGGILRLIKRILFFTFAVEIAGAALLSIRFCQDFGAGMGIYFGIFHSISAFCNAGFDLMGIGGSAFSSLTAYSDDVLVNLTICGLIIVGGMGYVVWSDIWDKRFRYRQYRLHTRIVLCATLILVFVPALLLYAFEHNGVLEGMGAGEGFLACLFQAVTPRTAGFNTVNLAELSDSSILLIQILMFIGGNSGSTAGGVKVTTMVVILFGLYSSVRGHKDIVIGKRSLDLSLAKQAMSLFTIYLIFVLTATLIICAIEPPEVALRDVSFECISAIATVGLTTGITPGLHAASKFIVTLLMFAGRLGVLTLASAMMTSKVHPNIKRPTEKILIG